MAGMNTEHLLGDLCETVRSCPRALNVWADLQLALQNLFVSHPLTTQVISESWKVQFLLNPTDICWGEWRLTVKNM